MSELSSVAGLHNHTHTHKHLEAKTETLLFLSVLLKSPRTQLHVYYHNEDSPKTLFTHHSNSVFPFPVCDNDDFFINSTIQQQ